MSPHSIATSFSIIFLLQGCVGINQTSSQALGQAGEVATQALVDQDSMAASKLTSLPVWITVREDLQCSASPSPDQSACLSQVNDPTIAAEWKLVSDKTQILIPIMQKRAEAARELNTAYSAFVDLSKYDASSEAKNDVKSAAASIDSLSKTIGTVLPAAAPAAFITPAVTALLSDTAGFVASERQKAALLQASKALQLADTALATNLNIEKDFVTDNLISVLQTEDSVTYESFVAAGLVSNQQVLNPLLQSISPGATMVSSPPASNTKVIDAAAIAYLQQTSALQAQQVKKSYDKAVAALVLLADQHQNLDTKASLDTSDILALSRSLETDLPKLQQKTGS